MTTYIDYSTLPPGPLSIGQGVTVDGQKYIWQNGTGSPGAWIAVDDTGGTLSTPVTTLTQETQVFSWDYAIDGGAMGTLTMRGGTVPAGAIIYGYEMMDVTAQPTDGGADAATITAGFNTASDIVMDAGGALTVNLITPGQYNTTIVAATTVVKLTEEKSLVMTINNHALDGGAFDVYLSYVIQV